MLSYSHFVQHLVAKHHRPSEIPYSLAPPRALYGYLCISPASSPRDYSVRRWLSCLPSDTTSLSRYRFIIPAPVIAPRRSPPTACPSLDILLRRPSARPRTLLRLIPAVLRDPNVLERGSVAGDLADDDHGVPDGLVGPPLDQDGDGGHDAGPEDQPEHQARDPGHHAAHHGQDLEGEEEEHEHEEQDDHVGRVGEGRVEPVEEGLHRGRHDGEERREEVDELPSEGLQRRRGREDVAVEEGDGLIGEYGCSSSNVGSVGVPSVLVSL